ncbi:hypothetical protein Pedsa_1741 [Pseudopedobacter saltans DSM 12145]|uniref:Uncharacterized protein n=1 Tax=Pseudopedobacter saltans (strain ATCC 51119 / DSM 12145 / JCM 21818 / CCUG 39354 / LMG 10337 / NBRC 100064 / NCIMB 13643) TaxID=762903 RepID=F0S7N8_PSESL|nr:hypothetical protein [Pseudopedobacter saltans]ADY52298.1 hypothetical protein Pedsa_1741 [Pseudopedobacter saltans DSM 12145]
MIVAELIQKEEITNFKIINAPEDHASEFRGKLENALKLGNAFKSKANIVFNTTEGPKRVETTVWNVTPDYLELKGGVLISTHSLLEIDY